MNTNAVYPPRLFSHDWFLIEQRYRAMTGQREMIDFPNDWTLDELERCYIEHILKISGGSRTRAASILGVSERTLYRRLEKHHIHFVFNGG